MELGKIMGCEITVEFWLLNRVHTLGLKRIRSYVVLDGDSEGVLLIGIAPVSRYDDTARRDDFGLIESPLWNEKYKRGNQQTT